MKSSAAALALLLFALPSHGDCAPKRLLHVVIGNHFHSKLPTQTLYRLGDRYGVVENPPDGSKFQMRLIVNEPDAWVTNLVNHTGTHHIDRGPTFVFRAPVFGGTGSEYWEKFEYGCEVEFIEAVGAKKQALDDGGRRYVHTADEITIILDIDENEIPKRVEIKSAYNSNVLEYWTWELLDDDSIERFQKPKGVEFVEEASTPR